MKWRKHGIIYAPDGSRPWRKTHAQLPLTLQLDDNRFRVYFASRDEKNRSHVCSVELDMRQPRVILSESPLPVLTPGPLGTFDDHGVYPASVVLHEGRVWMYYVGWNPGSRAPLFYSSIGLAVSGDGGRTFEKAGLAPLLARSEYDPCLVTSPCVLREDGLWRMWYVSGFKCEESADGLHSYYHVKYASSMDGRQWHREGRIALDLRDGEKNIARPCVLKDNGLYSMWYSFNSGNGYRIGYAQSQNGLEWARKDESAGINVSSSGWDSRAVSYPWVFRHRGRTYMLYNGNDFGREGFGLAEADQG